MVKHQLASRIDFRRFPRFPRIQHTLCLAMATEIWNGIAQVMKDWAALDISEEVVKWSIYRDETYVPAFSSPEQMFFVTCWPLHLYRSVVYLSMSSNAGIEKPSKALVFLFLPSSEDIICGYLDSRYIEMYHDIASCHAHLRVDWVNSFSSGGQCQHRGCHWNHGKLCSGVGWAAKIWGCFGTVANGV